MELSTDLRHVATDLIDFVLVYRHGKSSRGLHHTFHSSRQLGLAQAIVSLAFAEQAVCQTSELSLLYARPITPLDFGILVLDIGSKLGNTAGMGVLPKLDRAKIECDTRPVRSLTAPSLPGPDCLPKLFALLADLAKESANLGSGGVALEAVD